jgi:hypothetical protein
MLFRPLRPEAAADLPASDTTVPGRLASRLEPGETVLATLHAAQGAIIALTPMRILRWRPPGTVAEIELDRIETITVTPGGTDATATLAIVGTDGATLVTLRPHQVPAARRFAISVTDVVTRATADGAVAVQRRARLNHDVWSFRRS